VEQWRRSGLTAREFATKSGLNAGTLSYWKWRLARAESQQPTSRGRAARERGRSKGKLVELAPVSLSDDRVEVELTSGHRLRLPARFDAESLAQLLSVLGGAS